MATFLSGWGHSSMHHERTRDFDVRELTCVVSQDGETALDHAYNEYKLDVAQALQDAGANPSA